MDLALVLVEEQPEIIAWKKEFGQTGISPKTGGRPMLKVTQETDTIITIQAYEDLPERIVTFGWYDVDRLSGEVTDLLPKPDIE